MRGDRSQYREENRRKDALYVSCCWLDRREVEVLRNGRVFGECCK